MPEDPSQNPEFAAMQELIDECTPAERAETWKKQGNDKLKVYLQNKNRFYVRDAINHYSQALALPPWEEDGPLRSILLGNRAQGTTLT